MTIKEVAWAIGGERSVRGDLEALLEPAGYEVSGYREEILERLGGSEEFFASALQSLAEIDATNPQAALRLRTEIVAAGRAAFESEVNAIEEMEVDGEFAIDRMSTLFEENPLRAVVYCEALADAGHQEAATKFFLSLDATDSRIAEFLRLSASGSKACCGQFILSGLDALASGDLSRPLSVHLAFAVAQGEISVSQVADVAEEAGWGPTARDHVVEKLLSLVHEVRERWTTFFIMQLSPPDSVTLEATISSRRLLSSHHRITGDQIPSPELLQPVLSEFLDVAMWQRADSLREVVRAQERAFNLSSGFSAERQTALKEWFGSLDIGIILTDAPSVEFFYEEDRKGNFQLARELRTLLADPSARQSTLRMMCAVYLLDLERNEGVYPRAQISRELLGALSSGEVSQDDFGEVLASLSSRGAATHAAEVAWACCRAGMASGLLIPEEIVSLSATSRSRSPLEQRILQSAERAFALARRELGSIARAEEGAGFARGIQELFVRECRGRVDMLCRYGEPLLVAAQFEKQLVEGGIKAEHLEVLMLAIAYNYLAPRVPRELRDDYYPLCSLSLIRTGMEKDRFGVWGRVVRHPVSLDATTSLNDLAKTPEQGPWIAIAQAEPRLRLLLSNGDSTIRVFAKIRGLLDQVPPKDRDRVLEFIDRNVRSFRSTTVASSELLFREVVHLASADPTRAIEILDDGLVPLRTKGGEAGRYTLSLIRAMVRNAGGDPVALLVKGLGSLQGALEPKSSPVLFERLVEVSKAYREGTGELLEKAVSPLIRIGSLTYAPTERRREQALAILDIALGAKGASDLPRLVQEGVLYCIPKERASYISTQAVDAGDTLKLLKLGICLGTRGPQSLKNDVSWFLGLRADGGNSLLDELIAIAQSRGDEGEAFAAALSTTRIVLSEASPRPSRRDACDLLGDCITVVERCGGEFLWGSFEELMVREGLSLSIEQSRSLARFAAKLGSESAPEVFARFLHPVLTLSGPEAFSENLDRLLVLGEAVASQQGIFENLLLPLFETFRGELGHEELDSLIKFATEEGGVARLNEASASMLRCLNLSGGGDPKSLIPGMLSLARLGGDDARRVLDDELAPYLELRGSVPTAAEFSTIAQMLATPGVQGARLLGDGVAPIAAEFADLLTPEIWSELSRAASRYGSIASDALWYAVRPVVAGLRTPPTPQELREMIDVACEIFSVPGIDPQVLGELIVLPACRVNSVQRYMAAGERIRSALLDLRQSVPDGAPINRYRLAHAFGVVV